MILMPDEINFIDLAALTKIKPDTVVEKFGGLINSSYFDASNILGTLKQKGLIDFTTSFPGQSIITITELGKNTLNEADQKAKSEFDHLDFAIMTQLSNGKRSIQDLGSSVNVRPKDLAMHLYKLTNTDFVSYEFRNGNISISLTEKGFLQVKAGMPKPKVEVQAPKPQQQQEQAVVVSPSMTAAMPNTEQQMQTMSEEQQTQERNASKDLNELDKNIREGRSKRQLMIIAILVILLIAIVFLAIRG